MSDEANNEANQAEESDTTPGGTSEFVSPTDIAEQEAEEIYANRPATGRKFKRPVGRPTLAASAREKTRLRVQKFRSKQPQGIRKSWIEAPAALPVEQRAALEAQQAEASFLQSEMNEVISHVLENRQLPEGLYPDFVFSRIEAFITEHPLVSWWVPDSSVVDLEPKDWDDCDDQTFRDFGYRCHLVRLFHRVFISACDKWTKQNPELEMEPGVADKIRQLHIAYEPAPEPKYIPEPVVYQSEKDREAAIKSRELAEQFMHQEIVNLNRWQMEEQMGQKEG